VKLLGREQGKAFGKIVPRLRTEDRVRASARPVGFEPAVVEHKAEQVEVARHARSVRKARGRCDAFAVRCTTFVVAGGRLLYRPCSIYRFNRRSSGCPKGNDIQDDPDDEQHGARKGAGDAIIAIYDASPVEYREEEAEEQWRHHEESADDSDSEGNECPHEEN